MDAIRWIQVQEIFHQAATLLDEESDAFLQAACNGDPDLLATVQRLLEEDRTSFEWEGELAGMAQAPAALAHDTAQWGSNELPPDELLHYQFQRYLGQGGMGTVYLAKHRTTEQMVAIKVMLAGNLPIASRERFATEQRALARLNHPHIARLYGADKFRDGTPCFIMEYVEGEPLTRYCQAHAATIKQRILLFQQVCEAVRHAHENAIIHRDLKPSNILVKCDGTVRLLDFGIAKQLDSEGELSGVTGNQRAPLTLQYAAPEQVTAGPIGTHTDVYALGVTLYELLTEQSPIDLTGLTPGQMETAIQFQNPERPSRLMQSARDSSVRGMDRLGKTEWSDIDVLCATAMHKDVQRRYRSVEALSRDLNHWLRGEPLEAQADSVRYRLTKFAKRQRRALLTAAALLVIAVCTLTWFTVRLARARDQALDQQNRAERIEGFVLNLFDNGDSSAPSKSASALTMLERGRKQAATLSDEPAFQAELYDVLGGLYGNIGDFEQADQLFQSALQLQRSTRLENRQGEADSLLALAVMRSDQSKFEEAEKLARSGLSMREATSTSKQGLARAENDFGKVFTQSHHFQEARPHLERALRLENESGALASEKATTLRLLAEDDHEAGNYPESVAFGQQALTLDRHLYGDVHPLVGLDLSVLGAAYLLQRDYPEAEKEYRASLAIDRAWYGSEHMKTAEDLVTLGRTLVSERKYDEARSLLTEGLATARRLFGGNDQLAVFTLNALATLEQETRHYKEAEVYFQRSLSSARLLYGQNSEGMAVIMSNLGTFYGQVGQYARSVDLLREARSDLAKAYPATHPSLGRISLNIGRSLYAEGQYTEAGKELEDGIALLSRLASPPLAEIGKAKAMLAKVKQMQGT